MGNSLFEKRLLNELSSPVQREQERGPSHAMGCEGLSSWEVALIYPNAFGKGAPSSPASGGRRILLIPLRCPRAGDQAVAFVELADGGHIFGC